MSRSYPLMKRAARRTPYERRLLEPPRTLHHPCTGPVVFALVVGSGLLCILFFVVIIARLLPLVWSELIVPAVWAWRTSVPLQGPAQGTQDTPPLR
jgi:hypothetical protein